MLFDWLSPLRRLRERAVLAERRQAIAEERAAFLEREIEWIRGQADEANKSQVHALKVLANFSTELHFAIRPFPEAVGLPPHQPTEFPPEIFENLHRTAADNARDRFAEAERERFEKLVEQS